MIIPMCKQESVCTKCNRVGYKTYRLPHHAYERELCNVCINTTDNMLPCVKNEAGDVFGVHCIPKEYYDVFFERPDADPSRPSWKRNKLNGWNKHLNSKLYDENGNWK